MAAPVWQLSVNLETKTAAFTTGLADAAKGARSSFNDIKAGAGEMGASTRGSMMEARHGVMLLGEEFGVHLPRALTSFIASIGPVGAAMEAAFPFLAIIVGATLLIEHLSKLRQEGEKLTEAQLNFGTTVSNVLNGLDDKLLEAGIRTDELNHNHLGALNKQLELIDHQTFNELARSFDVIAKSADATFTELKASFAESFFQISKGAEGAKNALHQFKAAYDSLLAQHKDKEANDLLAGTLESAKKSYELMQAQQGGHGSDEKELAAQAKLVEVLQDQVTVREKLNALKGAQGDSARQNTSNKIGGDEDKVAREQSASQRREMEEAQKLWEENYRAAVSALQESEREKIEATDKGSRERLAAIDAAIKEENAKGLQETGFYKSLLTSRVDTARQMDEEKKKLDAEAGKEEAEHTLKMGELQIAAERASGQMRMSQARMSMQALLDMELGFAAQEHSAKQQALNAELAALDTHDKEYLNKKKALNDKLLELDKQFRNQDQILEDQAQKKQQAGIQHAEQQMKDLYAKGFTDVLMHKQSFAQMMQSIDSQIMSSAIQNALQGLMTKKGIGLETRFEDARTAAADAFATAGNPFLGAVEAAGAFASVMAFEKGGIVPGTGNFDSVHAMLTPGEAVIPKALTERLTRASDSGGGDVHHHHHYNPSFSINAVDGASVKNMLDKHSDHFERHFHSTLRKMNK